MTKYSVTKKPGHLDTFRVAVDHTYDKRQQTYKKRYYLHLFHNRGYNIDSPERGGGEDHFFPFPSLASLRVIIAVAREQSDVAKLAIFSITSIMFTYSLI